MYCTTLFAAALAVMVTGGITAFLLNRRPAAASAVGCMTMTLGGLAAGYCTAGNGPMVFFQFPIIFLGILCGIFSVGYLKGHYETRSGVYWFFYNLTVAAMLCVTAASSKFAFLVCWEIMGLASFALVAFDYKNRNIFKAAWIYLLACEAGGLLLIALFFMSPAPVTAFILALAGFGLKIGFPLLHVWLPEAHPAAPAPVSALMSGAMIQLGFYGIFFSADIFAGGIPMAASGVTLLVLGIVGAVGGILFALPQNNLKTLLAYSSIENMGIISIGIGLGLLGNAWNIRTMSYAGFSGAALHMINHALLKGGLFLGAGCVQHGTGSLNIDSLGGLLKRMPVTGSCFLLNSVGISGIPPFCGFVSEFLIYYAAICAVTSASAGAVTAGLAAMIALALTGGIAGAVFCKAACAFLGEPRSKVAAEVSEVSASMKIPVLVLFAASGAVPVAAPFFIDRMLFPVAAVSVLVWLLALILIWFRVHRVEKRQPTKISCTWDCGYVEPSARMEYTGSAFAQPLTDFFARLLRPEKTVEVPDGLFPEKASYDSVQKDPALYRIWVRAGLLFCRISDRIRVIQSGYLHLYILIITLVLIAMLVWALVLPWSGTLIGRG